MADSKLAITITSNTASAVSGIQNVSQSMKNLGATTEGISGKMLRQAQYLTSLGGAYTTVSGFINKFVSVSKELISIYSVQEQAETRLATTLKATGNAIGMSALELYKLASAFQDVTTYGDEAIIEVEKLFVASGQISKKTMPEAISATLDMAAAMGEDLGGAAKRLAKILADPKSNLDALKDSNIQLSAAQKEEIKSLQEANDLYGAQAIVLESVRSAYGGIAESLAKTDTGKLTQIKNVWGDIKEGLGEGLLNAISPALDSLYESLKRISDWIYENNQKTDIYKAYKGANAQGYDFSEMSDEMLQTTFSNIGKDRKVAQGPAKTVADRIYSDIEAELLKRNIDYAGRRYLPERLLQQEADAKNTVSSSTYLKFKTEAQRAGIDTNEEWVQKGIKAGVFTKEDAESAEQALIALKGLAGIEEQIKKVKLGEKEYSNAYDAELKSSEETASYNAYSSVSSAEEAGKVVSASDLISKYKSKSKLAQADELKEQIAEISDIYDSATDDEKERLDQITGSLFEQINALEKEADAVEDVGEEVEKLSFADIAEQINTYASACQELFSSVSSLVSQIYDNQISALDSYISEASEKWDKALSDLEERQELQKDSLGHLYDEGYIDIEEYNDAVLKMYEDQQKAEEEAAAKEEELQNKKNELEKKQFIADKANNLAQALINGALAITNIWANHAANPVTAGILTGLSAASTAAQIATISAQKYTPLAAGGIVSSPTYALLGEGGAKEAILPLTESNMEKAGLTKSESGVINLTINIGTSYSSEQLSTDVFKGIERAQKTGLLPNWRYA